MKKLLTRSLFWTNVAAFTITGLVVAGVAFGWTNPTDAPPTGSGAITADPSGNVGIGISVPTVKLDVNGTVKLLGLILPKGAVKDYVLTSDASGVASWKAASTVSHGMAMLTHLGSASTDQYTGSFVVPAGVTQLYVEVYGGGGGGGDKYNGHNGKSSSFMSLSATGGDPGNGTSNGTHMDLGGLGGTGSGGTANLKGGSGNNESVDNSDDSTGTKFYNSFSGNGGSNGRGAGGRGGLSNGAAGNPGNVCGGGAGGGPGAGSGPTIDKTGSGGGAGGVAMGWVSVTPSSTISYKVGNGGYGGDTTDTSSAISGGKGCIIVYW